MLGRPKILQFFDLTFCSGVAASRWMASTVVLNCYRRVSLDQSRTRPNSTFFFDWQVLFLRPLDLQHFGFSVALHLPPRSLFCCCLGCTGRRSQCSKYDPLRAGNSMFLKNAVKNLFYRGVVFYAPLYPLSYLCFQFVCSFSSSNEL